MSITNKTHSLVFITDFPEDIDHPNGGVEAVSVNLLVSLSKYTDFDIQVVTLNRNITTYKTESWEGVTIHRLPRPQGSELTNAIGKSKRLISEFVTKLKPDLIHAHDTYGIMIQDLDFRKVFTIHGFIYGDTLLASGKLARLRSWLWKKVELSSWAKQPNIISISPYVREHVSSVSNAIIYDIENPINGSFFTIDRKQSKNVIFTSAVVIPRKNLLKLVEATALLVKQGVDIQLRVAGSEIDQNYAQQVRQYVITHKIESNVIFLGRISTTQVKQELAQASLYALVSLEENAPMGIEEAMAAGVSVVTSNRCGMPYMVRNRGTGFLVNPFDAANIANKIRNILIDKKLRITMECKAKAFALENFHADKVAERTRDVYLEILNTQ